MKRALPVVLLLAACYIGPGIDTFAPARGPRGVAAEVRLRDRGGEVKGELLAVEDSALLVLREQRIVRVPLHAISWARFPQTNVLIDRRNLLPAQRDRLRQLSRFPAGVSPDVMARLLVAHGQVEPDLVPPASRE